jgi:hypothetical protein
VVDSRQESAIRDEITRELRDLAPGHPAVRVWGRLAGATSEQGAEGNAWAADPADLADVAVRAIKRVSGL